jgi:hypothetical protein
MENIIKEYPDLQVELAYFKRINEQFTLQAGNATNLVANQPDNILYMAMAASLAMDYSEDGFFEEFIICDKSISGMPEHQIDAYALIDSEKTQEKHLHLFQFKLHNDTKHTISPKELDSFATTMNNVFVHPELMDAENLENPVLKEIYDKVQLFINSRKGRKVMIHCHFINNAIGVNNSNIKAIEAVSNRFLTDKQHHNFKLQAYGLKDILELAKYGKISVDTEVLEFEIDGSQAYRLEDNSSKSGIGLPKKVFVGICNVNEFINLQDKYHHNQLYAENIRLYLGDRASVNKDIIKTITSEESIWFPYMNNGISIICEKFDIGNIKNGKKLPITLSDMQIINGCQTVNALYSARYGDQTKDDFRASNVFVKIYQIGSDQADFKMNVIRATNNQNAVKTYSLLANDPIQISIGENLAIFDYVYDRKGESKNKKTDKVVSMPNAALAFRAVYWFAAQALRSRMGHSRVFQKNEYDKLYLNDKVDDVEYVNDISVKLLVSTIIIDTIRIQIQETSGTYSPQLAIFRKSTYYLAGLFYAKYKKAVEVRINQMKELIKENIPPKIKGIDPTGKLKEFVIFEFSNLVNDFTDFYNSYSGDKTDLDNLLKSSDFAKAYSNLIKEKAHVKELKELISENEYNSQ